MDFIETKMLEDLAQLSKLPLLGPALAARGAFEPPGSPRTEKNVNAWANRVRFALRDVGYIKVIICVHAR